MSQGAARGGQRLRGRAGQTARRRRLMRTRGLCERCLAAGRTAAASEVDHVVPLARGGEDVDGNTRNLCRDCHRAVTAEQFGRTDRGGCDARGWPTDPAHAWYRSDRG